MTRPLHVIAAAGAAAGLCACPPQPVLQQAGGLYGTTIPSTPPSRVFLPGPATNKWLALNVPDASFPFIANLPTGITSPSVVELRGWLTEADPICNKSDPDWHFAFTPDPAWADALGISLNQLITAGNINEFTSSPDGGVLGNPQPLFHTPDVIAGWPIIHVELNGVPPGFTGFVGPQRPSPDWGFTQADDAGCPGVTWAFNPTQPLSFEPALKPNQYVRIVGSLVTDEPHAETGEANTWFDNNFGLNVLGPAGQTVALQQNWQTNFGKMDPNNPARWVEIHPPDVISVLNDVDSSGAPTKLPLENVTGVTLYSGGCSVLCSVNSLAIGLTAPGNPPPGASLQVMECVDGVTNFKEIVQGAKDSSGQFVGATITNTGTSATVQVAVQGEPGWGAPGKFKAIYRTGWRGVAPAVAPPGCTLH